MMKKKGKGKKKGKKNHAKRRSTVLKTNTTLKHHVKASTWAHTHSGVGGE